MQQRFGELTLEQVKVRIRLLTSEAFKKVVTVLAFRKFSSQAVILDLN